MTLSYHIGDKVKIWDYEFKWTADHQTPEQLRPLTYTYDELANRCLDLLDTANNAHGASVHGDKDTAPGAPGPHATGPRRDLYGLLESGAKNDSILAQLWTQVTTVPSWVSWPQIARGQRVFHRYSGPCIVGLTFQSLLGGTGSQRIAETLSRTGGFGVRVARRRLLETFQHILDVTSSLDSVQPGGAGFASTIRVRLLHAAVRRRILRLAATRPDYYDVSALGIPASDLDCAATIAAYSVSLVSISLPRQGITLTEGEADDYLALWRWIAHLIGAPTEPFATMKSARALLESLMLAEIQPSPTSGVLAGNIIAALARQPPAWSSPDFLRAEAYWLNGAQLSGALGLPAPYMYHTALVAFQCVVFLALAWSKRLVPYLDEIGFERSKRRLSTILTKLLEDKEPKYELEWEPHLGKRTRPAEEEKLGGGDGKDNRWALAGIGLATWGAWLAVRTAGRALGYW